MEERTHTLDDGPKTFISASSVLSPSCETTGTWAGGVCLTVQSGWIKLREQVEQVSLATANRTRHRSRLT